MQSIHVAHRPCCIHVCLCSRAWIQKIFMVAEPRYGQDSTGPNPQHREVVTRHTRSSFRRACVRGPACELWFCGFLDKSLRFERPLKAVPVCVTTSSNQQAQPSVRDIACQVIESELDPFDWDSRCKLRRLRAKVIEDFRELQLEKPRTPSLSEHRIQKRQEHEAQLHQLESAVEIISYACRLLSSSDHHCEVFLREAFDIVGECDLKVSGGRVVPRVFDRQLAISAEINLDS